MKSFFEDYQVKKYSFNDKIKWIFEHHALGGITDTITTPFDDITVEITEGKKYYTEEIIELIVIKGSNFEYSFPANMSAEIWKNTKKALRQCR